MSNGGEQHPYVFSQHDIAELCAALGRYPRLALAVSGGADSIALMLLVRRWLHLIPDGPQITVLTVDHGLRDASASEAEWVREQAGAQGFRHETLQWLGEKPRSAIQASARRARYDLLTQFCQSDGIPAVATAHTSDDQAETLIMRLARGSGLDGLAAMAPVSRWGGIDILRPLLGVSRRQILEFLEEHGQPWLDDPSNADDRHERVRVRRALKTADALGLSREKLALSAKRLTRAREAIDAATTDFLRMRMSCHPAGFAHVPLPALLGAPEEIALKALARMICVLGGASPPPRLAKLESCFAALKRGQRGATLGGCHLGVGPDTLFVIREFGRLAAPETAIHPGEAQLWDCRFEVIAGPDLPGAAALRPLGSEGLRQIKAADAILGKMPRQAAMTLPSLWHGDRLWFSPFVIFAAGAPPGWNSTSRAEFVVSEAFFAPIPSATEP